MTKAFQILNDKYHITGSMFRVSFTKTTIPLSEVYKLMKTGMEKAFNAGAARGKEGKFSKVINGYDDFNDWFFNK
jgi:hypothetical protein